MHCIKKERNRDDYYTEKTNPNKIICFCNFHYKIIYEIFNMQLIDEVIWLK